MKRKQATNAQVPTGCYPRMPPINITVEGVQKLLDKLNPYKAPGPDNLPPPNPKGIKLPDCSSPLQHIQGFP